MASVFATFPILRFGRDAEGKPICSCSKGINCASVGKHPGCSWSEITAGEQRARPGEPYGIPTGIRSGVFVVDTDLKPALGLDGDAELERLGGLFPTRTVRSGSGGHHYYLNLPPDFVVRNSSGLVGPGIDIRGEGGYVVGPGSPHKSGGTYELVDDSPVADAPAWLLAVLREQSAKRAPATDLASAIARGPEHADYQARIQQAVSYLQDPRQLPAEADQGGTTFFKVCVKLVRSLELPLEVCAALVAEVYNPRLVAMGANPWEGRPLEKKLTDARDKSDRPTGSEALAFQEGLKSASAAPQTYTNTVNPETGEFSVHIVKSKLGGSYVGKKTKCDDTELVRHLLQHPAWEGVWQYNEFTETYYAKNPPVVETMTAESNGGIHNEDMTRVKLWFEQEMGLLVSVDQVLRAIPVVARVHKYHPIKGYFESLPKHVGLSHFPGTMRALFGADLPIHDVMLRKWMIGAVKRILHPGCKVDNILVLQGRQGLKKSRFFLQLAGSSDYFLDNLKDVTTKDASDLLDGKWIVEFAELEAMERAHNNAFKAFVTRTHEVYRAAYDKSKRSRPRKCIFAGSTNDEDILRDATGGRRYWIVPVQNVLDEELLMSMRDLLWAEAYAAAVADEQHWLTDHEEATAEVSREQFTAHDEWTDVVVEYVKEKQFVTIPDVFRVAISGGDMAAIAKLDKKTSDRIGKILRKIGVQNKVTKLPGSRDSTRRWVVPPELQ